MILRLRRRHRATWIVIAILLPILYVIALAARRPAPTVESLPGAIRSESVSSAAP